MDNDTIRKRPTTPVRKLLSLILAFALIGMLSACGGGESDDNAGSAASVEASSESSTPAVETDGSDSGEAAVNSITYEQFLELPDELSYDEVVDYFGAEGERQDDVMGLEVFEWIIEPHEKYIQVLFKDGVSCGKIQEGLHKAKTDLTMEKYDQLQEDSTTLEEANAIMGCEGTLMSRMTVNNSTSSEYNWFDNDSLALVSITISETDNIIFSKHQVLLD